MLAVTVCGAVDPSAELGSLVCFDDLHFLSNRLPDGSLCTFFTEPGARERGHWIYECPFSADLRARAARGARRRRASSVRDGGCYGHVDGPRFNTRAEIRGLAAAGVTAVSQTAGPETVLCGEVELPYALLGFLTDYANGVKDEATPVETLVEMMAASTEAFASILRAALPHAAAATPAPPGIVYRFERRRLAARRRGRSSRPVPEIRNSSSRNASAAGAADAHASRRRSAAVALTCSASSRASRGRGRRPRLARRRRRG